ncbi:hypothetical protein [Ensifer sp. ENS09]|uniref:hypothetical protein n=1 Tax=Ensifer sp. ENS09 TaxID=2769263 RepID=UPI00352F92B1
MARHIEGRFIAAVDRNNRAGPRERLCHFKAETAAAARYQCRHSAEVEHLGLRCFPPIPE